MGYFENLRNAFHKATGSGTVADPFVPAFSIDSSTPGVTNGVVSSPVAITNATTAADVNVAAASTPVLAANAARKPGSYIICNTTAISYFNLGAAATVGDAQIDGKTTVAGIFNIPDGFTGAVNARGASATGTWRPVEMT